NHGDILLRSDRYDETGGNDSQHDGQRCSTKRSSGNCRNRYRRSGNLGIDRGYLWTSRRNYRGTRGSLSRSRRGSGGSASCVAFDGLNLRDMTQIQQLSDFIVNASFTDMSGFAVRALETRLLDALGCALGALENELIRPIKDQIEDFGGRAQ